MKIRITLFMLLFFAAGFRLAAQDGESLFKSNCGACHSVGKGKLVGPDLKNVAERHDSEWLHKWIKSSQSVVKSGDAAAAKLFADNNNIVMPDQTLSDADITAVLGYIKTKGEQLAQAPPPAPAQTAQAETPKENTHSLLGSFTFGEYLMFMLMLLMILVIWGMSKAIRSLSMQLKTKAELKAH